MRKPEITRCCSTGFDAAIIRSIGEGELVDEVNLHVQRRVKTVDDIEGLPVDTESVFVSLLTDEKVKALSRLTRLRVLYQSGNSPVTDDALSILGKMTSLEVLDLEWSDKITDRGLQHLYGLTSLRWLDIGFCRLITSRGVSALRSALPICEIDADGSGGEGK